MPTTFDITMTMMLALGTLASVVMFGFIYFLKLYQWTHDRRSSSAIQKIEARFGLSTSRTSGTGRWQASGHIEGMAVLIRQGIAPPDLHIEIVHDLEDSLGFAIHKHTVHKMTSPIESMRHIPTGDADYDERFKTFGEGAYAPTAALRHELLQIESKIEWLAITPSEISASIKSALTSEDQIMVFEALVRIAKSLQHTTADRRMLPPSLSKKEEEVFAHSVKQNA